MAYPIEADLESAIEDISLALLENRTLRNGEAAWDAWQQVLSHFDGVVRTDAGYGALTSASRGTDFGGV